MEFHYRAGKDIDPYPLSSSSSSSSDGYFADQARRAGLLGGGIDGGIGLGGGFGGEFGMGSFLPPPSPREALIRELQKGRIREEILAREITQKSILEEEVRRELELERALEMRRFEAMGGGMMEPERFGMESRLGERMGPGFVPPDSEGWDDERWALPPRPKSMGRKTIPLPYENPELSPRTEVKLPNPQLSGYKRKASTELPRPAKEWSCALCHVSAENQLALNEHLQGKKHKAKEAFLSSNKKNRVSSSASVLVKHAAQGKWSCGLCQVIAHSQDVFNEHLQGKKHRATEALLGANKKTWCTSSADGILKKNIAEQKNQQRGDTSCKLCRVKCNSAAMLACHLRGKKHKAQLEISEGSEDATGGTGSSATEVVKEVTDQTAKVEEKKEAEEAVKISN